MCVFVCVRVCEAVKQLVRNISKGGVCVGGRKREREGEREEKSVSVSVGERKRECVCVFEDFRPRVFVSANPLLLLWCCRPCCC